ncbi:MAG TPA: V-type ATP synthase subunit I [Candidatus Saccharicenans sp.]|jgi:V/A-type H+-transporting ATPase subunit I|nr:V-type ATP synthase subunit I [Candidatus Saccharicenans sp.]HRD01346.1 V-type ATP synthase subunit I [Candidatus Saccharicenans sp.]
MAIAPVKRMEVLLPKDELEGFVSYLQELGVAQLDPLPYEELELSSSPAEVADYERWLTRINHVIQNLPELEPKKGLEKLLTPKAKYSASLRKVLLDYGYQKVVEDYEELEARRAQLVQHIKQMEREKEFLIPLTALNVPLRSLTGLNRCLVKIAEVKTEDIESLKENLADQPASISIISTEKNLAYVLIIYHQSLREEVEAIFSGYKLAFISLDHYLLKLKGDEKVSDLIAELEQQKSQAKEEIGKLEKDMSGFAVHRPSLMAVYDVLLNEKQKLVGTSLAGLTEKTAWLAGWVPAAQTDYLVRKVNQFSPTIYLNLRDPKPEERDEVPVILDNPQLIKPFEVVTSLYGLPLPGGIDPTIFLAPFFFVFVGMCISEAGYGLVMSLLSLLYLKKAEPKGGTRLFMTLFFYLGISNMIFGTLFGGWFGFPIKPLVLIDPIENPIPYLILSLALGFIQVMLSTFLSLVKDFREGNKVTAIAVKGGWLLLLPSLLFYFLLKQPPVLGILALIGAAGIVFFSSPSRNILARFFNGLYALYGITSYFSDTLSYSRILALGLSTGVIAMVVNSLVQIAWSFPFVGWIIGILIFAGGHLFNLAIGLLGGFVHSMRLQFVEFFGRFYESGGKPFKPVKLENKYIEFIR